MKVFWAILSLVPWLIPSLNLWVKVCFAWIFYMALVINFQKTAPRHWFQWIGLIMIGFSPLILRLFEPALQSDDYLRYLFDGHLLLEGTNPYEVRPLDHPYFAEHWVPKPEIPTIYPPVAEGLFALASWFGAGMVGLRLMMAVALALFGVVAAKTWGLERGGIIFLLTLFCPLTQQELFHSAHIDAWVIPFLYLWLLSCKAHRNFWAGAALGVAGLIKLTPLIVLLPWLLWKKNQSKIQSAAGAGLVVVLGFWIFLPQHPFDSLLVFYRSIDGYSPLYRFFRLFLSMDLARALLSGLGVIVLFLWIKNRKQLHKTEDLLWVLAGLFCFTPLEFPWYLAVLIPLFIAQWAKSWLFFAGAIHLQYYNDHLLFLLLPLIILLWILTKGRYEY